VSRIRILDELCRLMLIVVFWTKTYCKNLQYTNNKNPLVVTDGLSLYIRYLNQNGMNRFKIRNGFLSVRLLR